MLLYRFQLSIQHNLIHEDDWKLHTLQLDIGLPHDADVPDSADCQSHLVCICWCSTPEHNGDLKAQFCSKTLLF